MSGLVLVVGDANPDLVLSGDVVPRFGQAEQLLDDAALRVGGSAAITAHGLARLNRPVALLAAVGTDSLAQSLLTELGSAGVCLDQIVQRHDQPTGLTVVLSRAADRAMLTHTGAIPSLTATELRDAVATLADRGLRHVHVASLFLQPTLAATLPGVLAEIRARGVTVSLDTNDDPAGRWQGVAELLPYVDVLLPNDREALALAGGAVDVEDAARTLAAHGPLVVVTRGERGAIAVGPGGTVTTVAATPVDPVDTTGAGDTFTAAFLDTWLAGAPVSHCLHRAVLAGAAAVRAIGGTAGQPAATDLPPRKGR
ncbi:MAG TPA: PfkB family carbohydrate kinase [Pseudonocardiaceae bacterium]|nr:PfkB family carbohydrate kinase [Pseudonocardiaceae bacterium]